MQRIFVLFQQGTDKRTLQFQLKLQTPSLITATTAVVSTLTSTETKVEIGTPTTANYIDVNGVDNDENDANDFNLVRAL